MDAVVPSPNSFFLLWVFFYAVTVMKVACHTFLPEYGPAMGSFHKTR